MKNLIHLALLLLISSVGFLQAQCPTAAYRTIDTSCLFLTFEMDPEIDTIYAYGDTFTLDGLTEENLYGYTRIEVAMCTDTLGMQPVTDTFFYSIGEDNYICTFEEGQYFPPCPDSAFISVDEMCITLIIDTLNSAQLSDSLIYNEIVYLFNEEDSNRVVFSRPGVTCNDEEPLTINGEVTLGSATCEYTSGVLPITIL